MNFKKEQYFLDHNNKLMNFLEFMDMFNQLHFDFLKEKGFGVNLPKITLSYKENKGLRCEEIYLTLPNKILNTMSLFYQRNVIKNIEKHPIMTSHQLCEFNELVIDNQIRYLGNEKWGFYLDFLPLLFKFYNKQIELPQFIYLDTKSHSQLKTTYSALKNLVFDRKKKDLYLNLKHNSKEIEYMIEIDLSDNSKMKETVITIVQFILNTIIEFSHSPESQEKRKELQLQYIEALGLQDFF